MGRMVAAGFCLVLWMARWAFLKNAAFYVLAAMGAGILSVWLLRKDRKALGWLSLVILLDAAGILMNLLHQPLSAAVSGQLHALLCSLTLPLATKVLTCKGGL